MSEPFLVPIDTLLFKEPVSCGASPFVIMALAQFYRTTNEHTVPITIRAEGNRWRILDGRHRVIASIIAGRKTVFASEE